jgi:mycofactocin precursor
MSETMTQEQEQTATSAPTAAPAEPDEALAEPLIEEISIDGMCGVY